MSATFPSQDQNLSSRPSEVIDRWLESDPSPQLRAYLASHRTRYTDLLDLLDKTRVTNGARALEVGCGDGYISSVFAERYGWRLAGVDYDEGAIARALDRGLDARLCDVDSQPLPFEDAAFELVLFDAVLEHLYNPRLSLSELARVTAPGGRLVLGSPSATDLSLRVRAALGINPFERLNRFNAIQGRARMTECAVLYTPDEVMRALQDTFALETMTWTNLFAHDRASRSPLRNLATPIRLAICRAFPRLSGYFYMVLRRKG